MRIGSLSINLSPRATYFYAAFGCLGLVMIALIMQYFFNFKPCPLCVLQRLIFIILGVFFMVAALHKSSPKILKWIYSGLILLTSSAGILASGRQVWLQHLPADQVPTCGPGINYMLQHLPLWEVLRLIFEGSGDCARVDWSWLGLSIAGWSFIFFVAFTLLAVINFFRAK